MLCMPPQSQSGTDFMIDQDYKRPDLPIFMVGHKCERGCERGKWRQEKGEEEKEGL